MHKNPTIEHTMHKRKNDEKWSAPKENHTVENTLANWKIFFTVPVFPVPVFPKKTQFLKLLKDFLGLLKSQLEHQKFGLN